mgnify:CR=1 FL=1
MIKALTKFFIIPAVLLASLAIPGCVKKTSSPVIARVGNTVLTVEDLLNCIPPEYIDQISKEENIKFVKQWIDTELLYREAISRKFDKDPHIKKRLHQMKKDLLAAEIINRSTFPIEKTSISKSAISDYFKQHQSQFIREREKIQFSEIVVDDYKTAAFIKQIANPSNFYALAAKYSKIPISDTLNIPYIFTDNLDPLLKQAVSTTAVSATTSPVKTNLGYHIILLLDKLPKGGICNEDEVHEEIFTLISAKKHKVYMDSMLSVLRLKNDVYFDFKLIPGNISDSLQQNN